MGNNLGAVKTEHIANIYIRRHAVPLWAVAQRLGLSYNYVSAILNGHYKPTPETEAKLQGIVKTLKKKERGAGKILKRLGKHGDRLTRLMALEERNGRTTAKPGRCFNRTTRV